MSDAQQNNEERRFFLRSALRTDAVFFARSGDHFQGITKDVSYNGAILLTPEAPEGLRAGETGRLHIALGGAEALEDCFAPYSCQVIRTTRQGMALKFMPLIEPMPIPEKHSRVTIRRSDGRLESDWEIPYPQEPMPARVTQLIQAYIKDHADNGPAALCYKKQNPDSNTMYKVYNIRFLIEVQKLANQDPNIRKAHSPTTEWVS